MKKKTPQSTMPLILQNRFLVGLGGGGLIISVVFCLMALPPTIPLFYGFPQGINQLVPAWLYPFPQVLYLALVGLNLLVLRSLNNSFLVRLLRSALVGFWLIVSISQIKIFSLVGYPLSLWSWPQT